MMNKENIFTVIIDEVKTELLKATVKFEAFHNAHEGYAVLLEEVDELWDNVKLNQKNPERQTLLKKEGVQVAAMALRFLYDCCKDQFEKEAGASDE